MIRRSSVIVTALLLATCHEGDDRGRQSDSGDSDDTQSDTVFVPQDGDDGTAATDGTSATDGTADADSAIETDATTGCTIPGAEFGCPCASNADCLDELCIEGPDGNFCTKSCIAECAPGYACLNTTVTGSDPISICVPQHTRLCRPCDHDADCQSRLDASPAVCVAGDKPEDGSFCATSCDIIACPSGFDCKDVQVGDTTQRLCRPTDGQCECRPSWAALAYSTTCERTNEHGTCSGKRECDVGGLSACSAAPPVAETCNLQDEDCDGTTDDIAPVACDITNDFGTCPGTTACDAGGAQICTGRAPAAEICNLVDDDCDGATDEAFPDCPAGGCFASDNGFVEGGAAACVAGHCVNPSPHPCGNYTCDGDACATSCVDDDACIDGSHCDANGACVTDTEGGEPCGTDDECGTGHCQNGFCCESGDCCQQPSDCPASYTIASTCDDATTCQGTRRDPLCSESTCTSSAPVADDSGCLATTQALDCAPALPRFCNGAVAQDPPSCASGCGDDSECLDGFHCDGDCVPDVDPGGTCDEDSDCGAAGICADGVCCDEACEGTCRACDVVGHEGECMDVPKGDDPDAECGAVACTGYYFGFVAKTCYLRAAVGADDADCDGDGACVDQATACGAAPQGLASPTVCHADCQDPTPATCSGTTPGACTNITGGTQSCGVGACAVTVDKCEAGAPKTCVPGTPSPEICDGIDNDCDGKTDADDDDLVIAPCENQKGVCSGAAHTAAQCVGGQWAACGDANYTAHSADYQPGHETTCETSVVALGLDNDCDGQVDEDFTYTSPAGTVVQGAAKACGVGECANGLTVCGIAGGLVCSNDFKITTEICNGKDDDCDGLVDSLDTADNSPTPLQQVACENQKGVCSGAMKPNSLCAAGSWQPCTNETYAAYAATFVASETTQCDGLDNDCNGTTDTALTAPTNSNQVGACSGTKQKCGGAAGWADDYSGVPGYGLDEVPDNNFADENCDGIDGDVDLGIFVSLSVGNDGNPACGTKAAPCKTLATGQSRAVATAKQYVFLMANASAYSGPLDLATNKTIVGGYNSNWVRGPRTNPGNEAFISGGKHSSGEWMVFKASGINATLMDLIVNAPSTTERTAAGQGKSSYAIHAVNSTITLTRVTVNQGSGAAGASGGDGTAATQNPAAGGGGGGNADEFDSACNDSDAGGGGNGGTNSCGVVVTNGGGGGRGGHMDTCCCGFSTDLDATDGVDGSSGQGPGNNLAPGGKGFAGNSNTSCSSCSNGFGRPGAMCGNGNCDAGENTGNCFEDCNAGSYSHDGGGGAGGGQNGRLIGDYWYAKDGSDGIVGSHGHGGGGGGGGGACDCGIDSTGAGGGGGGAGGCAASTAGSHGWGGGGSFGLFGVSSTLNVTDSIFVRGNGGNGGNGGAGKAGQPGGGGGPGGNANGDSLAGGNGGAGGRGGHSGGGGGGAGGVSYGVYRLNGSATINAGTTYSGGAAGTKGGGGGSPGKGGNNGNDGTVNTIGVCNSAGGC